MSSEGISYLRQAAVEDGDTLFNMHHRIMIPDGRIVIPGNAHTRIRTMIEDAAYWAQHGNDVYLAQGRYRNCGPDRKPYPKAIRQESNLISCKNLYMDIDVKDGGYENTKAIWRALKAFHQSTSLPEPTMIVGSGNGGLHIYWTLSVDFMPSEFRTMAGQLIAAALQCGVVFDRNCTSDPTRLLRVPGTWNFKTENTKPVELLYNAQRDIDLETMREALGQFKSVSMPRSHSQSRGPSVNDDLAGGTEKKYTPSDIDEVALDCPFIRETLETGGAGYSEPLWKYSMALAARCTEPEETAHRLSKGHAQYTPETTIQKLSQNHGAGPPLCGTIQLNGATQCAACPHFTLNTTPLAVGYKKSSNLAHSNFTAPSANTVTSDLPQGYYRGAHDDWIYTNMALDEGDEKEDTCVLQYQIIPGSATMEAGVPYMFSFETVQAERLIVKRFSCAITSNNNAFAEAFHAAGMPITGKVQNARMFVVNFLKQLQDSKDTLIAVPAFGWSPDHTDQMGFSYAGKFFSPNGEFKAVKAAEGAAEYRVQGDPDIWSGLMNIILTPERPDLACIVASSFGAPLVGMTGENGLLLGLWSTQSGIGKTTSMIAAQAVWGKPVIGGLSDTINYTFAKCATLRHLPIYYDEIKGDKQIKAAVELVFQLTGGKEKGRSGRGGEMRAVREFETLCAYCSNSSLVESVREHHQGTDASWLRMFEMQALVRPNEEINFTNEVRERLTQLRLNFGGIGMKYAEFLGRNQVKLSKALLDYQIKLAQDIHADPQVERFWIAAMSTTMLGAWCANKLKLCTFPLDEMRAYMVSEYQRMKQEMTENPSDLSTDIALSNAIGAFLNEKAPRNMIILDKTWIASTKPPKDYAKVLNDKNDTAWGAIEVQVSGEPLVLRISDTALGHWCLKSRTPKNSLVEQFKKKLNARMSSLKLGSGSYKAAAAQNVWVIEARGTILEDMLEYGIHHKFLPP